MKDERGRQVSLILEQKLPCQGASMEQGLVGSGSTQDKEFIVKLISNREKYFSLLGRDSQSYLNLT